MVEPESDMTNLITQIIPTKTNLLPLSSVSNKKLKKPPTANSVTSDSIIKLTATKILDRAIGKQSELIQLLQRPDGIALSELMRLSNWQAHSIRGWISGTLGKKLSLVVIRFKSESGETCYRIESSIVASEL